MKKQVLSLGVAFATFCALADTASVGGYTWTYRVNGGTAEIYNDYACAISPEPTGVVTIPSMLGDKPVTSIGSYAFAGCSGLTNVTIPGSVTGIGEGAFVDCSGLVNVTIPDSVTSIGTGAFYDCSGLVSVTIPDSVTSIGDCAFMGCNGLADGQGCVVVRNVLYGYKGVGGSLSIPDGVTSIGAGAFSGCNGLACITMPDTVTRIENAAFFGCSGLTNVIFNGNAPTVGELAFEAVGDDCVVLVLRRSTGWDVPIPGMWNGMRIAYLPTFVPIFTIENGVLVSVEPDGATAVTIPGNVTSIGGNAFDGCHGLTSVSIPDSVTSIEYGAFSDCSGLKAVTVPQCVCSDNMSDVFPSAYQSITNVVISNGVTGIGDCAFGGCVGLTGMVIPGGVTNIGWYAFEECTGLTSVEIGAGVTDIGGSAFSGCCNLTNVTMGGCVESIGDFAFFGCESLMEVAIPDSVVIIGDSAFFGCEGLTSVTIPQAVLDMGFGNVFPGCDNLSEVVLGEGVTSIEPCAFSGCEELTSVMIAHGVTNIGISAFSGCIGLTSVTIPDSVTRIGERAFSECCGLTSVTIPNSVIDIGCDAFYGCFGIATVTIPQVALDGGLWRIFTDCDNLSEVILDESVTNIVEYAFEYYSGLTKVTIPDCVTRIGEGAFYECIGMTSVTIPDGVREVGDWAFCGCVNLSSVTIPDSVSRIGVYAFQGCNESLYDTTADGNAILVDGWAVGPCSDSAEMNLSEVRGIADGAFSGCHFDWVTIGYGVDKVGAFAFEGCTGSFYDTTTIAGVALVDGWVVAVPGPIPQNGVVSLRGVRGIAAEAFAGCPYVVKVTADAGLSVICERAFAGCSALASASLGSGIRRIGEDAFLHCNDELYDDATVQGVRMVDGWVVGRIDTSAEEIDLDGARGMADWVFANQGGIVRASISAGMRRIPTGAFFGCGALSDVSISDSVDSIGRYAFTGCAPALYDGTSILGARLVDGWVIDTIPDAKPTGNFVVPQIRGISDLAFSECNGLTGVVVPSSVLGIGYGAFSGCGALTNMVIPFVGSKRGIEYTVDSVFGWIFGSKPYPGGVAISQAFAPNNCCTVDRRWFRKVYYVPEKLRRVEITDCAKLAYGAFYGCDMLANVILHDGLTDIGVSAFRDCTGLSSMVIPDSVEWIDESAFYGCKNLASVVLGEGLLYLGHAAFGDCGNLASVYFTGDAPYAESDVFEESSKRMVIQVCEGTTGWLSGSSSELPARWPESEFAFEYNEYARRIKIADGGSSEGGQQSGGGAAAVQHVASPYSLTNAPADRAIASVTVSGDMALDAFVLTDGKVYDSVLYINNTADHAVTLSLPSGHAYEAIRGTKPLSIPANSRSILSITRVSDNVFLVARQELETIE